MNYREKSQTLDPTQVTAFQVQQKPKKTGVQKIKSAMFKAVLGQRAPTQFT